jgi:hypothetical protein
MLFFFIFDDAIFQLLEINESLSLQTSTFIPLSMHNVSAMGGINLIKKNSLNFLEL